MGSVVRAWDVRDVSDQAAPGDPGDPWKDGGGMGFAMGKPWNHGGTCWETQDIWKILEVYWEKRLEDVDDMRKIRGSLGGFSLGVWDELWGIFAEKGGRIEVEC